MSYVHYPEPHRVSVYDRLSVEIATDGFEFDMGSFIEFQTGRRRRLIVEGETALVERIYQAALEVLAELEAKEVAK